MGHSNCDKCGHDTKMCSCDNGIANKMQVGGDHYTGSDYQHWDWTTDVKLLGLEYAATKYLSRWWKKNGLEDLKKPIHYMIKAQEMFLAGRHLNESLHNSPYNMDVQKAEQCFGRWITSSNIPPAEAQICLRIAKWRTENDVRYILNELDRLYKDAAARPTASLDTGGHGGPQFKSKASSGQAEGRLDHPAPFGYTPET